MANANTKKRFQETNENPVKRERSSVTKAKVVNCQMLRIRIEPNGEELTVIPVDTVMSVKESSDPEWFAVKLDDGTRGYAMSKYLELI